MKIIKDSGSLTAKQVFNMTSSSDIGKFSEEVGNEISVAAWVIYDDEKKDGTTVRILSIMDDNGRCYATNSRTFQGDFIKIQDLLEQYGGSLERICVLAGMSKNGREFISCKMA